MIGRGRFIRKSDMLYVIFVPFDNLGKSEHQYISSSCGVLQYHGCARGGGLRKRAFK